MKLSYLVRGLPGHPLHPPLTDATIGIYSFATIAAFLDVVGLSKTTAAHGWWIALLVGRNDFLTGDIRHRGGHFLQRGAQQVGNELFGGSSGEHLHQCMQLGCLIDR